MRQMVIIWIPSILTQQYDLCHVFFSTWVAEKIQPPCPHALGFRLVQMRPLILHITAHSGMLPPKFSGGTTGESRRPETFLQPYHDSGFKKP